MLVEEEIESIYFTVKLKNCAQWDAQCNTEESPHI